MFRLVRYRFYLKYLCLFLAYMFASFCGHAQSTFHFRFMDAATGVRVIPTTLTITPRVSKEKEIIIDKKDISANGEIEVQQKDGVYDIGVEAKGYKQIHTWFEVRQQKLKVNIKLDPEKPVSVLTHDFIGALHTKNAMVVTGFVVDDAAGKPLTGVMISTIDDEVNTYTDSNGYYLLRIPLANDREGITRRGTLLFEKSKYTTEIRQQFDMWGNGDMILPVRMQKGSGEHVVNILEKREPYRETIQP